MEATKEIAAVVLFVHRSHFRPIELICGPQRIGGRGVTEWKGERVEGETEGWKVKPWSEKGRQLVMPCLRVCVTKLGSGFDCFVWRDTAAEGRAHENDSVKVPPKHNSARRKKPPETSPSSVGHPFKNAQTSREDVS